MIDRETIDRIYAAADIVDVVSDYVTLKRKGVNYQACCPFHNEKTPSFVVSPSKGIFRCFGCGKSGNAVTFVMQHESLSYPEALRLVAKKYGIEVKEKEQSPEDLLRNNNRESMFALNAWAGDYFSNFLIREDEGRSVGLSYFRQSRGFSDNTITKFALGFCPAKGDTMSKEAAAAGYKSEFLVSTGLSLERDSDHSLYDRFRERVMFPIHNISGRIVGFGGRTLRTDKKVAKYQNSPESEIYSKKRELYGLFFAKKAIQQHDFVIMVEGYTDVISMHQAGIENVVSSSGTSLTVDQVRLLNRFTKNITVIYDGDAAGIKAAIRGIDIILREGMNVRVVSLPPEHDPDSFARSHTADEVQEYVKANEEDFLTFKAKMLLGEAKGDPIKRADMIKDMVGSISQIPDQIRRSVFAKECSRIMDISENVLLSEIAHQLAVTSKDPQTSEFLRNQQRRNGELPPVIEEVAPSTSSRVPSLLVGSSIASLEREIVKYLLRNGHEYINLVPEGGKPEEVSEVNVASLIFEELMDENITLQDAILQDIFTLYHTEWKQLGEGVDVPAQRFLESDNVELCNRTTDILTDGDNYTESQLWKINFTASNDKGMLEDGVCKVLLLYKSKRLVTMINELIASLNDENISEDESFETLRKINDFNNIKVNLSKKIKRLNL